MIAVLMPRVAAQQAPGARVRVIVGMRENVINRNDERAHRDQAAQAIASAAGAGVVNQVSAFETLPYFTADVDAAGLAALTASPFVTSVVQDVPRPAALSESAQLVGAPDAWEAGYGGAGWHVAILDTGVAASHPFLNGKIVHEACFSTTDTSGMTTSSSLCPGGLPSASGGGAAAPCQPVVAGCDHGTHVAGIAAGSGPSFSGVARDAAIVSIQVFSKFGPAECGSGSCLLAWDSDVIAALDYVYSLRTSTSIAAVNVSLGSSIFTGACDWVSPAMTAAIGQLRDAGIATVVAAGNGQSTTGLSFPACISAAVSVGSTTKGDVIATTSNTARFLSLLAPGESIQSSVPDGGYASKTGTSMAAPHVAGAWAVMKQRKPSATVADVLAAMRRAGRPVTDGREGSGLAFPRLRVHAAMNALMSEPVMALDTPAAGNVPGSFAVAGWAADLGATAGVGVDAVHIWAFPQAGGSPVFLGVAAVGERRDDVAAVLGTQFRNAGFRATVTGLPAGTYTLAAMAHSMLTDAFDQSRTVAVTSPLSWPEMSLDGPVSPSTAGPSFVVNGWAVDRMSTSGPGVDVIHVWAFPVGGGEAVFAGQAPHGSMRPDVGHAFGPQFDPSGFAINATLPPGTYDLVAYARSAVTGQFNQARLARVTVNDAP